MVNCAIPLAFCIEKSMQLVWRGVKGWTLLVVMIVAANATPGSFRGTIVDSPNAARGWIYVQGHNGTARKVNVAHAMIVYDEDVPAAERSSKPQDALVPGSEVRVTAEQGSDGEWHASRIEIIKSATPTKQSGNGRGAATS
jgi:hypothetical protein